MLLQISVWGKMMNFKMVDSENVKCLLADYENALFFKTWGHSTTIKYGLKKTFFKHNSTYTGQETVKAVLQYIFEVYLEWTPEDVVQNLTKECVKKYHLEALLLKLPFPELLNRDMDTAFYAYIIYPDLRSEMDKFIIETKYIYHTILNGTRKRYPKGFLDGVKGELRAKICLKDMVVQYIPFRTIEDLYIVFANDYSDVSKMICPEGIYALLKKMKLYNICMELYDKPIDFLHDMLPESQKNYTLYEFYTER